MGKLFKDNNRLGVIISRMQVPYLTESHINMIQTVQERHSKLLILLGVSDKVEFKDPFSFLFRAQMLEPYLRDFDICMPVKDNRENNKEWVKLVDLLVSSNLYNNETPILYGGRDSFIPSYKQGNGIYPTIELLPEDNDSGTELRNLAANKIPQYSREVAEGILYTMYQFIK